MSEQSAHIVMSSGWGNTWPIVVRVCTKAEVLIEASLGLSWNGPNSPFRAWMELGRRADVALAELGYVRTADWQAHVYPQPIAEATVTKSG
jgi:hypothetical protein